MIVDAKLTRTGVFDYMNPDGTTRREYRPPSEVFDAGSLDTFLAASVTNDHPASMVTPETAQSVTVGMVSTGARKLDTHVAAELVIFDAKAIADVKAGKTEISCGYEAEVLDSPSVSPQGEHYDSIQKNIRINHVAIVDRGRAGPEAAIRMDAAMQFRQTPQQSEISVNLEQALQKINDLMVEKATESARADRAELDLKTAVSRADKSDAERDSAKEQLKAAETRADNADGSINERVNALTKLRADAGKIVKMEEGEDDSRFDALTDRELQVKVIQAVTSFEITDKHSDDYVTARYDAAVEQANKSQESMSNLRQGTEKTRNDAVSGESAVVDARKAMLERQRNASKARN